MQKHILQGDQQVLKDFKISRKEWIEQQLEDGRCIQALRATVVELDLQLSYFGDLIQLSADQFRQKAQDCSPHRLLLDGVEFCNIQAPVTECDGPQLKVRNHFEGGEGAVVRLDALRFKQAFFRLIQVAFAGRGVGKILLQGAMLTGRQLRVLRPAFKDVVDSKIDKRGSYLTMLLSSGPGTPRGCGDPGLAGDTPDDGQSLRGRMGYLFPILLKLKSQLWVYRTNAGTCYALSTPVGPLAGDGGGAQLGPADERRQLKRILEEVHRQNKLFGAKM